jgi:hypothetical protein
MIRRLGRVAGRVIVPAAARLPRKFEPAGLANEPKL